MQSELPIALNVFHTDYLLEYSESYSGISTVLLYEEPLSLIMDIGNQLYSSLS